MSGSTLITTLVFICLLADQSVRCLALVAHRNANTPTDRTNYSLVKLPLETGAACLDGSPAFLTIFPGKSDKWTIVMLGGASCYDAESCEKRSRTNLGSSKYPLPPATETCGCMNFDENGQKLDCTCVNLGYCDGGFFAGHLEGPYITPNGTELMVRGFRNLNTSLDILLEKHGLKNASELVLTGASSGGVSAIMQLDNVAKRMPESMKVFGVPKGGWTLDHKTHNDETFYMDLVQWQYFFHHSHISSSCREEFSDEPWKCLVASHAASFVKSPLFILNSKYDAWQMTTILGLRFKPIYEEGAGTGEYLSEVSAYGSDFMTEFNKFIETSHHAAFITSCICHVECSFGAAKVGDIGLQAWLGKWYKGDFDSEPALIDESPPNYDCDPSGKGTVMMEVNDKPDLLGLSDV